MTHARFVGMTDEEVGKYWDGNADAWTTLSRAGYDVYRDLMNTPAFLLMLPDVSGRLGLDVGCGEGTNTRQVAERGAKMMAVDVSPRFVAHAIEAERREPRGIEYGVASGQALPFANASFDFVTSFMCMMDLPDPATALSEIRRVLRPGGFFQFSITHPCFNTPHRKNLRDESGKTYAIEVGKYYDGTDGRVDRWIFGAAPASERERFEKFAVPFFHRTLSDWINIIVDAGLTIERVGEPQVSEELARQRPEMQDTRVVAYFLHVRCRKGRT